MKEIFSWIGSWTKRYFLWVVGFHPFVTPFLYGVVAGIIAGFVALPLADWATLGLMFGFTGVGAGVGIISLVVCHLFVSYSSDTVLFLATYEEKFQGEFVHRILRASGNPLWWEKFALPAEEQIWEVRLADTNHVHVVDVSPPGAIRKVPAKIHIFFKGEFGGQEVYERVVQAGYSTLDGLVRQTFLDALDAVDGLKQKLLHMSGYSLVELEGGLEEIRPHFSGPGVMSNIDHFGVKLAPSVTVRF